MSRAIKPLSRGTGFLPVAKPEKTNPTGLPMDLIINASKRKPAKQPPCRLV